MLTSREYIGISLEGDFLKIARVKPQKKGIKLIRLDKLKLIEPLKVEKSAMEEKVISSADVFDDDDDTDSIFGLDDELGSDDSDSIEEIDLDSIEDDKDDDLMDSDLVAEASKPRSNEELIVNYLDDFLKQKVILSLNVETGSTIFQIFKDINFNELKKKEVKLNIEERLEAIYGEIPMDDFYDFFIRENGNLVLASVDEESRTLQLINRTANKYERKYYVNEVLPDEISMVGLYRTHYPEEEAKISGLIQFGADKCRMIFVQGHKILQVSPVINEGTNNKNFLNTIFSKILFQLDTGEIPGIDRFILFNNNVGESAVEFFEKNFPDLECENFSYNSELFEFEESMESLLPEFTTAISIATRATGQSAKQYPPISFLPKYVSDKQKIFKLHWHGILLLILIGISPVIGNHYYQEYSSQIDQLSQQTNRLQLQIDQLAPLVRESEELTTQLNQMQNQLSLLSELSQNNIKWTVTLDRFNRALEEVGGIWVNSFRQNEDVILIDGYSLRRDRIPQLANKFPSVTLMSVQRQEIRTQEVFYFNMMIRRVVEDESVFTPGESLDLEQFIN